MDQAELNEIALRTFYRTVEQVGNKLEKTFDRLALMPDLPGYDYNYHEVTEFTMHKLTKAPVYVNFTIAYTV